MVRVEELLRLSSAVYTRRRESGAWRRIQDHGSVGRGFRSAAWIDDERGDIVLSIRGTAGLPSAIQDLSLLFGREPGAWRCGRAALQRARRALPRGGRLYLTGHSIGGAFASVLGAEHGLATVTFNAPGMLLALRRAIRPHPLPSWLCRHNPHVVDVGVRQDWIRLLSGPSIGARYLVGPAPTPSPSRVGPRALGRILASGLRAHGAAFVRESIRRHEVRAFRPIVQDGSRTPWQVDAARAPQALRARAPHLPQDSVREGLVRSTAPVAEDGAAPAHRDHLDHPERGNVIAAVRPCPQHLGRRRVSPFPTPRHARAGFAGRKD